MPLHQDTDARITLTRVAAAPRLVAEVARLARRRLEVSPTMGAEVLMVSVQDAKVSEVLARLATASTAVWEPMEGGLRLVPDKAARGIEATAERARRLQRIQEELGKRRDELAQAAKPDRAGANAGASLAASMMGMGGVDAFVPLLDLGAVAAMDAGDRIVFATNPNSAQIPLRGDAGAVVRGWIEAHNRTARSMTDAGSELPDGLDALMKGPMGDGLRRMSRPVTAPPAKVVVVASRGATPFFGGGGADVRLEVRAYAGDGTILLQETGSIGSGMAALVAAMKGGAADPVAPGATPIVYSDDAKALIGITGAGRLARGGANAFGNGLRIPKTLQAILLAPDRSDPLGLLPGEGLVALAKARRKPLVACLPDDAFPGILGGGAPKTVEEVEASLRSGTMRAVPDATFLLVKPAEPDAARRARLDRTALASLMRAIDGHEVPSLDELAEFAARTPAPGQNAVTMFYLSTFAPNTLGGMGGMVSWDALRLYGGLAPGQRQALASGGRVPFGEVSPLAKAALGAMLYGATGELRVDRPGAPASDDPVSRGLRMALGGGGVDVRDEPTEVAPRGLPTGGYLQGGVESDTILRPITSEGPSHATLSTEELATLRMISTGPMAAQIGDAMRLPEVARVGSRAVWRLRGYVAEGVYVAATLTDDRTPADGPTVSLSALPPDLQARVAQRTEAIRKSPLGAIMAMGAMMGKPAARP